MLPSLRAPGYQENSLDVGSGVIDLASSTHKLDSTDRPRGDVWQGVHACCGTPLNRLAAEHIYLGSGMIKDCKIPNICATIQE
jgi:hypothetical protein